MDPPEEIYELPPWRDDDDAVIDEYEIQGLVRPPSSSSRSSRVGGAGGAGGGGRSHIAGTTGMLFSWIIPFCSIAFDPHNRSKSAMTLIFILFLCTIMLTEIDTAAVQSIFGRINHKSTNNPIALLTDEQRQWFLKSLYGSYTFYDGSAEDRPTEAYMTIENAENPYLDLPESKFPLDSWQADAVYSNHFLDAAENLVRRGQQAIFATYHGHGVSEVHAAKDENGEMVVNYIREDTDVRLSQEKNMFHLDEIDLDSITSVDELQLASPSWEQKAGWTTKRSFDGLQRRLIHAMMVGGSTLPKTQSNFTVVITGSWQNMGYGGNHAWQSMAGVFESLLTGLFDKLGVNLVVRAIGLPPMTNLSPDDETEGISTLLHTLGWSSIYGSDVDMVVWDDYGTVDENGGTDRPLRELSAQLFDLFARQALLSGKTTLPFIWGGDFDVLRNLHNHANADVGQLGNALAGVPLTTSEIVGSELPWAAQDLNCPLDMHDICKMEEHQFESQCWVERPDITPPTPQLNHIPILPSAVGWRMHKLKGSTLAYVLLSATLGALLNWSEITISQGFPLADEYWHMGEYIKNVQDKIKSLDESVAPHCFQLDETINLPKRLCRNRLSGRTEHTPRANPLETSIRSILDSDHHVRYDEFLPSEKDVMNPLSIIPRGEVDAIEIIDLHGKWSGGDSGHHRYRLLESKNVTGKPDRKMFGSDTIRRWTANAIKTGEGWQLLHSYGEYCDGTLSSTNTCGKLSSSNCLLEGHQGSRGGIYGNETTGWLVLHGITPENGFIAFNLKFGNRKQSRSEWQESLPGTFILDYAIGGKITTLDKTQLIDMTSKQPPGVNLVIVLNDEKGGDATNVDVAVRVQGCDNSASCEFALTHVYWS